MREVSVSEFVPPDGKKAYRFPRMELHDDQIAPLLLKRDEAAFEQVFKTHYKNLYAYAFTILKNKDDAEEIVQRIFVRLWERSENLSLSGSIAAYLYRAVHNESLNFLKHQKVKASHQLQVAYSTRSSTGQIQSEMMSKELENKYREALNELPEQCRTVFQLSRFEDLKYREIAVRLGISIKTVEIHMGKALKLLKLKLVDFLIFILIFLKP